MICIYFIGRRRNKEITSATSTISSGDSSSSSISTSAIEQIVEDLKFKRYRGSTRQNYYTIWKSFNTFIIKLDRKPEAWEDKLTLFVGYLIEHKKKSSTIRSYISAIKAVLKDIDVDLNENRFLLTSLTNACKLVNDKVRVRLPIQKGLLSMILDTIILYFDQQPYLSAMYSALFSTMYFGLFRIGEMASGTHPVKACDVHISHNKKKMLFILRTSKTHWTDVKPQHIKISSKPIKTGLSPANSREKLQFCPFTHLKDYIDLRSSYVSIDEPFFVYSDRQPLPSEDVRRVLKIILKKMGLEPINYNTHSIRIGRCVDLQKMNISVETIKSLGRWRSNAVFDYLSNF